MYSTHVLWTGPLPGPAYTVCTVWTLTDVARALTNEEPSTDSQSDCLKLLTHGIWKESGRNFIYKILISTYIFAELGTRVGYSPGAREPGSHEMLAEIHALLSKI